jgi:hypothetical protein
MTESSSVCRIPGGASTTTVLRWVHRPVRFGLSVETAILEGMVRIRTSRRVTSESNCPDRSGQAHVVSAPSGAPGTATAIVPLLHLS